MISILQVCLNKLTKFPAMALYVPNTISENASKAATRAARGRTTSLGCGSSALLPCCPPFTTQGCIRLLVSSKKCFSWSSMGCNKLCSSAFCFGLTYLTGLYCLFSDFPTGSWSGYFFFSRFIVFIYIPEVLLAFPVKLSADGRLICIFSSPTSPIMVPVKDSFVCWTEFLEVLVLVVATISVVFEDETFPAARSLDPTKDGARLFITFLASISTLAICCMLDVTAFLLSWLLFFLDGCITLYVNVPGFCNGISL